MYCFQPEGGLLSASILSLYSDFGQSLWLDGIDRDLLTNGSLERLVAEGIRGATTNPTRFERAAIGTESYDDMIRDLLQADHGIDGATIYRWLVLQDAQIAADILRPVYDSSDGSDGYVSVPVSPQLAHNIYETIEAARHLWRQIDRPNLMIEVPATTKGLAAIERLVSEGINVNATLLFSLSRYREVAQAYLRGIASDSQPARVSSVASFSVGRIDSTLR